MNKKILIISNMYPTSTHKTFGVFVKNQANALRERGNSIDVVAIKDPQTGKKNVFKKYIGWMLNSFFNLILRGKSYDIIHAHYVFPSGMLALLYKKWLRKPFIVTAHGGDIDRMAKKNARIRKWTQKILNEADHVIAVGQALHDEIVEDFNISKEKVSIMSMGVNRQVFRPYNKQEMRRKLGISDEELPIVFVGNMIREKGVQELIEAFQMLQREKANVKLYLIGSRRNQSFLQELDQLIQSEQIRNVQFIEPKPQKELAEWMSAAEIFVLPSHIEGFGLVAVEAMSCHTPVVGTEVGGLSYLLKDSTGYLVEVKNSHSLFEGMKIVLDSISLRHELIRNGELRAQENDETYLIEKLEKLYESVCKRES